MIEARIHMPTPPSEARWHHLMALAEVLSNVNAEWFVGRHLEADRVAMAGYDRPEVPCCITCVEPPIRYAPPPPGAQQLCQNWWPAPAVIARGKATCLDAAAFDVGAARAKGKEAYVYLEPVGEPVNPDDPFSTLDFHAVAYIDGERIDSSEKLVKQNGCNGTACAV